MPCRGDDRRNGGICRRYCNAGQEQRCRQGRGCFPCSIVGGNAKSEPAKDLTSGLVIRQPCKATLLTTGDSPSLIVDQCTTKRARSELGIQRWVLLTAFQERLQLPPNMGGNSLTRRLVALALNPYLYEAANSLDLIFSFLEYSHFVPAGRVNKHLAWASTYRLTLHYSYRA